MGYSGRNRTKWWEATTTHLFTESNDYTRRIYSSTKVPPAGELGIHHSSSSWRAKASTVLAMLHEAYISKVNTKSSSKLKLNSVDLGEKSLSFFASLSWRI